MNEYCNKHYIRADASGNIVEGWSSGPHRDRVPTDDDILINGSGGYQFRLYDGGEENPPLFDDMMIPLYKWTGSEAARRSEDEIAADRALIRAEGERKARLAELHKKLEDTDYIAAKIAEGAATREEYAEVIARRQAWRDEINALESEAVA